MTQSPQKAAEPQYRKLEKGVGYIPIFWSESLKVEISLQGTTMRRTLYRDGLSEEYLYTKVTDKKRIEQIEYQSENWTIRGINSPYPYLIQEQRNAGNQLTGFYKVIEKDRACVATRLLSKPKVSARYSEEDWIYYEKRKGYR